MEQLCFDFYTETNPFKPVNETNPAKEIKTNQEETILIDVEPLEPCI